MNLFKIEDYKPVPTDELYYITQFNKLLSLQYNKQAGDTQGRLRVRGMKELTFIYFSCDYRSKFSDYSDKQRRAKALEAAGLPENHPISSELFEACEFYKEIVVTRPIRMLLAARGKVDNLTEYFEVLELTEINEINGELSIKEDADAKSLMANIATLAKLLKGLDDLEEQIKKQESDASALRGDAQPGRLQ